MKWDRIVLAAAIGMTIVLAGCQKSSTPPEQKNPPAPAKSTSPLTRHDAAKDKPSLPVSKEEVKAADTGKDDPAAPGWLPKPDEIPGWVRTSNVKVVYPGQWDQLENQLLKKVMESYSIKQVAMMEFKSSSPNVTGATARIVLAEANFGDDAYGVFTSRITAAPDASVGSLASFSTDVTGTMGDCWQGKYYVHASATKSAQGDLRISVQKLVAGLVKPIPSADPPAALNYLPTAGRLAGQVWVVRKNLDSIPPKILTEVLAGKQADITKSLDLNADTLMAVVGYDAGANESPNYIWIVQYPTAKIAAEAHKRLEAVCAKWSKPMMLLEQPRGKFLFGSFTADQESLSTMQILPQTRSLLPKS